MTTSIALTLLGFGLGALIVAGNRSQRGPMSAREKAIAAQKISAEASRVARDLMERASKEETTT
jgi:hypothetical protein